MSQEISSALCPRRRKDKLADCQKCPFSAEQFAAIDPAAVNPADFAQCEALRNFLAGRQQSRPASDHFYFQMVGSPSPVCFRLQ